MPRALPALAIGALLGGVSVYLWHRSDSFSGPESPDTSAAARIERDGARSDDAAAGAAVSNSPALDDPTQISPAGRVADATALLAELSRITPPARQREAALAALETLGNDDASIARIAAMLPEANRLSFRIDALAARAASSPASALRSALALDNDAARQLAIPRIAQAIASQDAEGAVTQAVLIGDRDLRMLYLAGVAEKWAESEPAAALDWIESAVPSELTAQSAASALDAVAAGDLDFLLARLDTLAPTLRTAARQSAMLALVERDPPAALAQVETLGTGLDMNELAGAVAERYAHQDAAAAVRWAKSLPNPQTPLEGAIRGAADADYDAAVDLALELLETEPIWGALALGESGAGDFGLFVDRLWASDLSQKEAHFNATMVRWPQVDADAALEWALANGDKLDTAWFWRLTLDGGRENPDLAIAVLDNVPPDLRDEWIAGIAGGIAAADSDRALAFLEQHRGQPGYDQGLYGVVDSLSAADPIAAARLVESTGAGSGAAGRVAWAWSQQDPVAASTWVAGLEDPEMRRDAIGSLALNLSRVNPSAAIDWLLDMPADQGRDFGLQTALSTSAAATGEIDTRALNAIGDERVRNQGILNAITAIARSNPDRARRLVDEHIDDPIRREQALQRIAEQPGGMVSLFTSQIDIPR